MTTKQKKLVQYWLVLVVVIAIGTYISLSEIEEKQMVMLFLAVIVAIASLFQDFSYYTGYGGNRKRIGKFIKKHTVIKHWLVLFCLTILPFMVYKMGTTDNDMVRGYLYFLSFAMLIGPIAVVSEIERYRSLGE